MKGKSISQSWLIKPAGTGKFSAGGYGTTKDVFSGLSKYNHFYNREDLIRLC